MPAGSLRALPALAFCCTLLVVAGAPGELAPGPQPAAAAPPSAALLREPRRWSARAAESYEEEDIRPAGERRGQSATLGWPFQPIQFNVDIGRNTVGTVPLVVIPIPMAATQQAQTECDAGKSKKQFSKGDEYEYVPPQGARVTSSEGRRRTPPRTATRAPAWHTPPAQTFTDDDDDVDTSPPSPAPSRRPDTRDPVREPSDPYVPEENVSVSSPKVDPIVSSQQLVEEFRAQQPTAPQLPPALLSEYDASERAPLLDDGEAVANELQDNSLDGQTFVDGDVKKIPQSNVLKPSRQDSRSGYSLSPGSPAGGLAGATRARDPPRPRYASLPMLHGQLTVPRADYTEPYSVWFDETSGSARVDYHGGATSTFRTMTSDGRVQRTEVRLDRSGEGEVRRCAVATSPRAAADRAHPALPDLAQFTFAGYEEVAEGRVEVWRRAGTGRAGERGGARGEALSSRHELRLARRPDDTALPIRYTVTVDSSTLGSDCDGYEHYYASEPSKPRDAGFFNVDLDKQCDEVEYLNGSSADAMARLEPLREFTLPHRDPRYDEILERFKVQYERQYVDEKEEAVRKNLLMQNSRFVASGNRQGATAEVAINFLGDRLGAEVRQLQGVALNAGAGAGATAGPGEAGERFPHSREDVRAQDRRLPSSFDWRARGGVSPVRYQGSCSSCWAFAVAGAVEGALFRRSRRLVPLSEQCLVDCAHPYGGKGCKGTWPSHAYNYVQERGLPALDEYPAYKEKVGKCVDESVPSQTRISAHVNVTTNSVPALKIAIRRHAPSVVIVDADAKSFIFYKKGVLYDDRCHKALKDLHHAVLAVGWSERKGEPHFILKNSWSAAWGDGGYVRVQARANTCGVLTKPSYPRLEEPDVARPQRTQRPPARRARQHHLSYYDDLY